MFPLRLDQNRICRGGLINKLIALAFDAFLIGFLKSQKHTLSSQLVCVYISEIYQMTGVAHRTWDFDKALINVLLIAPSKRSWYTVAICAPLRLNTGARKLFAPSAWWHELFLIIDLIVAEHTSVASLQYKWVVDRAICI